MDARSDLFSLGVVFYELLTGHRPFEGATYNHVLVAILDQEPPPLHQYLKEAPPALAPIVSGLLTKDREARYQTAQELLTDLHTLRDELTADARLQRRASDQQTLLLDAPATAPRGLGRKPVWRLGVALAILLLAVTAWFVYQRNFQPLR